MATLAALMLVTGAVQVTTAVTAPSGAAVPAVLTWNYAQPRYFSPNGDGQDDTVDFEYCASEPANVYAVITDAAGKAVRALLSGLSVPSSSAPYCPALTWDGTGDRGSVLADGLYTIHLTASNAAGDSNEITIEAGIETRAPGALSAPAAGATLAGQVPFTFTPTAGFPAISQVAAYCANGSGDYYFASTAAPDGSLSSTMDMARCTNGANGLVAVAYWTDPLGGYHSWTAPALPVTVATRAVLSWATAQTRYFSPNGDGQEDTFDYTFCASQPASADAWVADSGGARVRTLLSAEQVSPSGGCWWASWNGPALSWDGTGDGGSVLADGLYTIHVTASNAMGDSDELTIQAGIETRAPGALSAPAAGATIGGLVPFTFTPTAGFPAMSSAAAYCANGSGEYYFASTAAPDGSLSSTMDMARCANGDNGIVAVAYWADPLGGYHSWTAPALPVTVATPPVLSPWSGQARYFSPNGDGQEDTFDGGFCASQPASADAWVTDPGGATVRTLLSGQSVDGCTALSWDGAGDGGSVLADGVYTIHITATNAAGDSNELAVQAGIETRAPGALSAPAAGDTLAGQAPFTFTPTAGFPPISSVAVSCTGASGEIGAASQAGADGSFSSTLDVATCANGANGLVVVASWSDPLGGYHWWTAPAVPVTMTTLPVLSWTYSQARYFSPNGDGLEDTFDGGFCVSQPASADAWVTDPGGATVRTLLSGQSVDRCTALSWDGAGDSGSVLADGVYTVHVAAANAAGSSDELTVQAGIDTRVPGALSAPAAGATLAGLVPFVFTPTAGSPLITINSVTFSASTGGSVTSYNALADGTWSTTLLSGQLTAGDAEVVAGVSWVDALGGEHYWTSPPNAVVIDTISLPLAFAAAPTDGLAPLGTRFAIDTSDPHGGPVSYAVDYGDGSPGTQDTANNPYPTITLDHTYAAPGTYTAIVNAANGRGVRAAQRLTITVRGSANTPPTATLAVTPTSGVAPLSVTATIDASDADNDPLTYTLDFGDGGAPTQGPLPSAGISHIYTAAGTYSIRAEVSDGSVGVVKYAKVSVGLSQPLTAAAGDDQTVAINAPVTFDGSGSVPAEAITSYSWDFGDGASSTDPRATHAYAAAGTYTVTLMVASGAETASGRAVITVLNPQPAQGLAVSVTSGGALLAGVAVVVIQPDGSRISGTTGANGEVLLSGLPDGEVTAYVWASGYQPTAVTATIADGHGDANVDLAAGPAGAAILDSRRLSLDEITAAGIDVADPENYHVYEATIDLFFVPIQVYVTQDGIQCTDAACGGSGAGWGAGGCAGFCVPLSETGQVAIPNVIYVQGEPIVQWLVIPMRASFLKEFFEVQMVVQNLTTGF
ncbi:MAG: PKD domain-containing protein, partial [Frankiaceae bacterium]|nr:PKD domain-containing protein [Frankiaceae bacterium]